MVGVNLNRRLHEAGACVLTDGCAPMPGIPANCTRPYDFTRLEDCLSAAKGMDHVIICEAPNMGIKARKEDPTGTLLPNIVVPAGLLEACYRNKVERVVLLSSAMVYQPCDHPITEDELDLNQLPPEIYLGVGWGNRYLEQLAVFYQHCYGMEIGVLRPSNIYGPHDHFDDGCNVLPALIRRAVNKEDPFVVWGDGKIVRDFIFVEDFIDDLLWVLENYCVGDPINSGYGKPTTIYEAAEVVLDVCGHHAPIQLDPGKPTAVPYRMLDLSKREQLMGIRIMTSLREGIERTRQWYLANEKQLSKVI